MARYGIVMASGYSRMDDGMKIPICMNVLYCTKVHPVHYYSTCTSIQDRPLTNPQLQGCLGVLLYHPVSLPPRLSFSFSFSFFRLISQARPSCQPPTARRCNTYSALGTLTVQLHHRRYYRAGPSPGLLFASDPPGIHHY
jgi:hypothetical protein